MDCQEEAGPQALGHHALWWKDCPTLESSSNDPQKP